MNKEEIKHFKAMLRQGILRHKNILLDYKFQDELLNIIKDYEKLQQENNQLKEQCEKQRYAITENCDLRLETEQLKEQRQELRSWLEETIPNTMDTMKRFAFIDVLSKLNELDKLGE